VPSVAVLTDSTAYLPAEVAHRLDVTVVPLLVVIGDRVGAEGVDVTPADVAVALTEGSVSVTTSRPSPQAFATAYAEVLARTGASALVSIHLSADMSGTAEAARLAAHGQPDVDVRVVDSRSLAMGLGFPVLAAAEAAQAGASVDDVIAAAERCRERTRVLLAVDTLEHLRRGGRIGAAAGLLGTALAVKPILQVANGRLALREKVRTTSRATRRLVELAVEEAADGPVDVAVHHLAAANRAAELTRQLREQLPALASAYCSEVGAVVGAHVGPGAVGVVISRH
jgi:fatty acid kinase fatty acid binding subunit